MHTRSATISYLSQKNISDDVTPSYESMDQVQAILVDENGNSISESNNISDLSMLSYGTAVSKQLKQKTSLVQTKIDFQNNNPKFIMSDHTLDMVIADFIHSKGLPFSIVEDIKFKQLIFHATRASHNYECPSRKKICGEFLDHLYSKYKKDCQNALKIEQNKYGLSIMGDGATIKKNLYLIF